MYEVHVFHNKTIVDLENNEFIMIRCLLGRRQAVLLNHFSLEASKRSKTITKNILNKLGITQQKPLGVYILMLDSISRQHFYRNLKSATDYLNTKISEINSNLVIYDFLLNNVQGKNTMNNLTPLLFGKSLENHETISSLLDINNKNHEVIYKQLQEFSL